MCPGAPRPHSSHLRTSRPPASAWSASSAAATSPAGAPCRHPATPTCCWSWRMRRTLRSGQMSRLEEVTCPDSRRRRQALPVSNEVAALQRVNQRPPLYKASAQQPRSPGRDLRSIYGDLYREVRRKLAYCGLSNGGRANPRHFRMAVTEWAGAAKLEVLRRITEATAVADGRKPMPDTLGESRLASTARTQRCFLGIAERVKYPVRNMSSRPDAVYRRVSSLRLVRASPRVPVTLTLKLFEHVARRLVEGAIAHTRHSRRTLAAATRRALSTP